MIISPLRIRLLMLAVAHVAILSGLPASAHDGSHERIDRLTREIAANPSDIRLLMDRATAYRDDDAFDEALHDYALALQLAPNDTSVVLERAETLFDANRVYECLEETQRILRENPNQIDARILQARARFALGASTAAARDFDAAILVADRLSPDLVLQCVEAHVASGNYRQALAVLKTAAERLGALSIFTDRSIALELEVGDFESALSRLDQMLSDSARKERLLARRGEILEAAGRFVEAQQSYQRALDALNALPKRLKDLPASRALAASLRGRIQSASD